MRKHLHIYKESDKHLIYLIKCGRYVKIGKTTSEKAFFARLTDLNIGVPYPLHPICVISSMSCGLTEKQVHNKFSYLRHKGEWFIGDEDIYEWFFAEWCSAYERRMPCSSVFNTTKATKIPISITASHSGFCGRGKELQDMIPKIRLFLDTMYTRKVGRPKAS